MKKILIISFIFTSFYSYAQETISDYTKDFELGNGVNFSSNDNYFFKLSGMIQPSFSFEANAYPSNLMTDNNVEYFFNSKRSFFSFSGYAKEEKVSFLVLSDFSLSTPLLDAWIAYDFNRAIKITFGQKLSKSNNREMLIMEDMLQFTERSLLSSTYSLTGREFGLFLDFRHSINNFGVVPSFSLTSGDGRSSFGSDSRDVDLGGFKYSARVDLFPFGFFKEGNENKISDVMFEDDLKFVLGLSLSYNDGASNSVGEGHGDFYLWNVINNPQMPDYSQLYVDFLCKFRGASFLAEYVVTSASSLNQIYSDPLALNLLVPQEISEYLSLGSGFNSSVGYVFESGVSIDFRYTDIIPEYATNSFSIVKDNSMLSLSLSKYFVKDNFKLMTSFSQLKNDDSSSVIISELVLQLKI